MSFLDNRGPKAYALGGALAAGERMYVDREYVYTSIPAVLKGHAYLVTASTLNPQPSTFNSTPSTPNPQPSTLTLIPQTPHHTSSSSSLLSLQVLEGPRRSLSLKSPSTR